MGRHGLVERRTGAGRAGAGRRTGRVDGTGRPVGFAGRFPSRTDGPDGFAGAFHGRTGNLHGDAVSGQCRGPALGIRAGGARGRAAAA